MWKILRASGANNEHFAANNQTSPAGGEEMIPFKGLFTYYVSRRRGGEGVWQMLTIADEGG